MGKIVTIGIDLGGTRIKAVAIDETGSIIHHHYQPTNDGDDLTWKNAVAASVRELQNRNKDSSLITGISAPGLPNDNNTEIAYMPGRLKGLENFNWARFIGSPAFVLNDAVSAMMAEARFGAAKNKRNVPSLLKESLTRVPSARRGT